MQFPIWGLPRELGLKGAVFADAGTLFDYRGVTTFDINRNRIPDGFGCPVTATNAPNLTVQPECIKVHDNNAIRSSVGASVLWSSPLGPIRFDYAWALSKDEGELAIVNGVATKIGGDRTQAFRFSGGTRF
jgi:outer membrane protein insertion porin family